MFNPKNKIIARGAEAVLYVEDGKLIKERISKGYRVKELDNKLRKIRTKSEAKLLERAKDANVPRVFQVSDKDMKISMEYIDGELVKNIIDELSDNNLRLLCMDIGKQIANLHSVSVVHGDLTTSNMILRGNEIYLIDLGLGFVSDRTEDRAVDLRLLRQALESKHYRIGKEAFEYILQGYSENYKNAEEVITRLKDKVEKRGRYKRKTKA